MSRYVDAEWLIKESMPLSFSVQKWVNEVQIMTAPSINIVKCKECKHRHTIDCFRAYLEYDIQEWVVDSGDDDDFCSYGEREDE